LANSRRRPISRSLVKQGTLEGRHSAPRTAQTNSPTVSIATHGPEWPAWTDADIIWLNEHPSLPPIAGGSSDDESERFEPTDADWDDFARWSGALTDEDIMAASLSVG
jgi:hypothetical protein